MNIQIINKKVYISLECIIKLFLKKKTQQAPLYPQQREALNNTR